MRGMHFQAAPHQEAKLVHCTQSAIHDVIIDIRPGSPTFTNYLAIDLSADSHNDLYDQKDLCTVF